MNVSPSYKACENLKNKAQRYAASMSAVLFAVSLAIFPVDVFAQPEGHHMDGYHAEMQAQMQKMNKDMMSGPMTGNPDLDFAVMMIPHHQGAIDMAKTQLKYGKDTKLRALAEEIIMSQQKEIEVMQTRITDLGGTASASMNSAGTTPSQTATPMVNHSSH